MLIGIDASRTTPIHRTGTEAYSLALIRALLELPTEHRWRLYFNQPPASGSWPAGSNVELRIMPWPRLWTHMRLSAEMMRSAPDVLFVPAHVLPLVRPPRSVVTIHDLGYHYFPRAHPLASLLYLRFSTRMNARLATLVIVDSHATRADLMRIYSTPAEKIRVVYPGRDERLCQVQDEAKILAVARRLGIDRPYILYIGTLQPRKNLTRLIEAYQRVLARWSKTKTAPLLVLAGRQGWLSESIFRAVTQLGLEHQVRFPGYVPDADLPALLSGASVFVFPSLYEGFGFPVLEAMACEVPVVCSNTSSLPEVAGEAALQVDPLDVEALAMAIEEALGDERLRTRLIEAGKAQITRFSWQRAAQQTLSVLEEAATL